MDTFGTKTVTNRKPHKCHGCLREIAKGEKMTVSTVADNGEIWRFRRCGTCKDLMNEFCSELDDGYGLIAEGAVDEAVDFYGLDNPEELLAYFRRRKDELKSKSK